MPSRTQHRSGFTLETRVALLEGDMDDREAENQAITAKLDRILWWAIGLFGMLAALVLSFSVNLAADTF